MDGLEAVKRYRNTSSKDKRAMKRGIKWRTAIGNGDKQRYREKQRGGGRVREKASTTVFQDEHQQRNLLRTTFVPFFVSIASWKVWPISANIVSKWYKCRVHVRPINSSSFSLRKHKGGKERIAQNNSSRIEFLFPPRWQRSLVLERKQAIISRD